MCPSIFYTLGVCVYNEGGAKSGAEPIAATQQDCGHDNICKCSVKLSHTCNFAQF